MPSRATKVGIFVGVGVIASGAIVFTIGENRHVFDKKHTYTTSFVDVGGIKGGAPVRMGGVDIGMVKSISYQPEAYGANATTLPLADGSVSPAPPARIVVTFDVMDKEVGLVEGCIASRRCAAGVAWKGMLGDKMLELSIDRRLKDVNPPNTIKGADSLDMGAMVSQVQAIAAETRNTVNNLSHATQQFVEGSTVQDIKGTAENLRIITEGVAQNKDGAAHKLLFDRAEAQRIDRILTNLEGVTAQLNETTRGFNEVASRVKTGPGLAHDLLYDDRMGVDARGIATEVHSSLSAIRTGNGVMHGVVYGDENTGAVMSNVAATFADIRAIVGHVKQGKGTVGGLLMDPSVYEDIKQLVGNVDRNHVLRALVRYSIREDETRGDGPRGVKTPAPSPAGPAAAVPLVAPTSNPNPK